MSKTTTSLKIEKSDLNRIKEEIEGTNTTQSEWIRDAIRQKLNQEYEDIESLTERINNIETALIESAIYGGEPAEHLGRVTRSFGGIHDYTRTEEK